VFTGRSRDKGKEKIQRVSLYREYTGKSNGKNGGDQADVSHVEEDPRGLLRDRTHDRLPD